MKMRRFISALGLALLLALTTGPIALAATALPTKFSSVEANNIIHRVDSIAALRLMTGGAGKKAAQVLGYATPGDGGGGVFVWSGLNLSSEVTGDPRGGIYVAPTAAPTGSSGAWVRSGVREYLRPEWWGGLPTGPGDTAVDSYPGVIACIAKASTNTGTFVYKTQLSAGVYHLATGITLPSAGVIHITGAGPGESQFRAMSTAGVYPEFLFQFTTSTYGSIMENIQLYGGSGRYVKYGIKSIEMQHCSFRHMTVSNFAVAGIQSTDWSNEFIDIEFANCGIGIWQNRASNNNNIIIDRCHFVSCIVGVVHNQGTSLTLTNNQFQGATTSPYSKTHVYLSGIEPALIQGNYFEQQAPEYLVGMAFTVPEVLTIYADIITNYPPYMDSSEVVTTTLAKNPAGTAGTLLEVSSNLFSSPFKSPVIGAAIYLGDCPDPILKNNRIGTTKYIASVYQDSSYGRMGKPVFIGNKVYKDLFQVLGSGAEMAYPLAGATELPHGAVSLDMGQQNYAAGVAPAPDSGPALSTYNPLSGSYRMYPTVRLTLDTAATKSEKWQGSFVIPTSGAGQADLSGKRVYLSLWRQNSVANLKVRLTLSDGTTSVSNVDDGTTFTSTSTMARVETSMIMPASGTITWSIELIAATAAAGQYADIWGLTIAPVGVSVESFPRQSYREPLNGSLVWDPASLADGAGETSSLITVYGAALGDFVLVSPPYDMKDLTVSAYVQIINKVEIRIQNESGGVVDLGSGTWRVKVIPYR